MTLPLVAACGATVLGLLGLGAGSAGAATPPADTSTTVAPGAAPTEAAPIVTSSSTVTLPLLGVPLTVDLTTGPGGALATVFVNPADGFTATAVKPNKVAFVNDAGTAKVVVKTGRGTQSIEAKASTLDDFTAGGGAGAWTGDVFGTGTTTTVNYVIAAAADGSPDITGVTSSDPSAVVGQVQYENDDDDDEREAKVRVTFTNGGQSRTLSIKVEVESDDGTSRAKVKISLSPLKGVALPADQVAGPQVWTGVLCDGTAARIDYVVDATGTISSASATPDAERLDVNGNQLDTRWAQGGRVKIKVRGEDGQLKVSVQDRTRCESPDPSVNTPVSPEATDSSNSDHGGNDGGDGGGDDNGGRRGGRRGDGSTTTTVAGASETTAANTDQTSANQTSGSSSSGSGSSGRNGGRDGGDDRDDSDD